MGVGHEAVRGSCLEVAFDIGPDRKCATVSPMNYEHCGLGGDTLSTCYVPDTVIDHT